MCLHKQKPLPLMPDYTPVSCDLQAHLEAIATQKRQCRITYRERADKLT